jgi:hypothetical protein
MIIGSPPKFHETRDILTVAVLHAGRGDQYHDE